MSDEEKLREAMAFEGFLGMQKAGVINVYQKRYVRFIDEGLTFAYAQTMEDFERNKIAGFIPLKDVLDIVSEEKPKKFQLVVEGKVFKFEAASPAEKFTWVNAIYLCREYALKYEAQSKAKLLAIDSEIRFEESSTTEGRRTSITFNPLRVFAKTAGNVVFDTAVKSAAGVIKTGVNTVAGTVKTKANEDYLKAKKLDQALDYIDAKILQSRIMMGNLFKENKETTGFCHVDGLLNDSGIRDPIAKRWCLLISSKPLDFDTIDKDDEETLDNGKLPFEIEPETLYIYDGACDESKPLESIPLKDVFDITVKKKNPDEQYYRFVLDLGEKKINLLLNNITDMTKWVRAIQAARANRKEKTKSKLPSVRNIFWHLKLMVDGGEVKVRAKVEKIYEKITSGSEVSKMNNIKDVIKIQEKVALELIAVVNACLVHKDQKVELVKIYMDIFHESIVNTLRAYFKRNQDCLGNKDIFEIIKFLIWYRGKLKMFGDAFADTRLTEGIDTLCRIVGVRILKTNMKAIKNILKQEFEREPEIDGRGRAATTTPSDVFKLTNETFNVLSYCNTQELGLALLDSCSMTIQNFQNGLAYMMDSYDCSLDHLAAFCNNTLAYMMKAKEFGKQAEQIIGVDREVIVEHFNEAVFNKTFVKQGKMAYEMIAEKVFNPLAEQWEKVHFLEINLEKSMSDPLGQINQLIEKIHGNFTSKIEACCLERTVAIYIQAFLDCAEKKKLKSEDLKKIAKKLETDQTLLRDLYSNVKAAVVESMTSIIRDFHTFLTQNYTFLSVTIQNMKEQYGNSIRWSTFEILIKLRNDSLDRDQRNELYEKCEDFYRNTQKKVLDKKKSAVSNVLKHVDQGEADTSFGSGGNTSFMDDDNVSEAPSSVSSTSTAKSFALNIEGYLEVSREEQLGNAGTSMKPGVKFEEKYFNLKRDVLYYYKQKNCEFSSGSYKLKEMTDAGSFGDDNTFFITLRIKDIDVKTIFFKASTLDKRDQWVEYIKEASKLPDLGLMVELNASDVQLFKDRTKPLFEDIEDMPNLEFTSNRPGNKGQPIGRGTITTQRGSQIVNLADKSEEGQGKRRRSFDLSGPVPTEARARQQPNQLGCVASFCNVFSK